MQTSLKSPDPPSSTLNCRSNFTGAGDARRDSPSLTMARFMPTIIKPGRVQMALIQYLGAAAVQQCIATAVISFLRVYTRSAVVFAFFKIHVAFAFAGVLAHRANAKGGPTRSFIKHVRVSRWA